MNPSTIIANAGKLGVVVSRRLLAMSTTKYTSTMHEIVDPPESLQLAFLNYERRRNDPIATKKARLIYQSRKRGILENGLLLGTFVDKYLPILSDAQIDEYDKIINLPSNDWDIFYWAMGMRPIPAEFDNSVMEMLKKHLNDGDHESRLGQGQPPLFPE